MQTFRFVLSAAFASALSACAMTPVPIRGDYADVQPGQAAIDKYSGTQVRWGGIVTGQRLTDAGLCVEVAAYALDRFSLRPLPASAPDAIVLHPRFLACGNRLNGYSTTPSGDSITLVGTISASRVYQVDRSTCVPSDGYNLVKYAGTAHAANAETCVISLPTIQVAALHEWSRYIPPTLYAQPFEGYHVEGTQH